MLIQTPGSGLKIMLILVPGRGHTVPKAGESKINTGPRKRTLNLLRECIGSRKMAETTGGRGFLKKA